MTTECETTADRPAMVVDADRLALCMHAMFDEFPEIHDRLISALGRAMKVDGVMEFTVSELAKKADVRLGATKEYLHSARQQKLLQVLGRRTDNGRIRYCAYATDDISVQET